ncbi:tetratricopeptide repeat-containing response regulator [Alteromonas sp. a30]|uniref:tetratricopeptide repeat-containing response regulator n=1 Tax=Alteromonas sp. a30 TaxID=2730917 RepID=UPI0022818EEE|nr:tetratricopeptide repeat-containing response regulator [Alteromonas sp. a30]MCY7294142.1 response regulator [Alteromonas sp. a30]
MAQVDFGNMRVLVVDDQRPFLVLLRGMANALGAKSVVTAQNGEAAVVACRKEKFDIIVSDVHLGSDKKNGYQFLEEIRILNYVKPETVFVMVSGDNQRPVVLGSLERQPDDYLIKPFSQAQLSNRLQKAYLKKQELKSVYKHYMKGDIDEAINVCRELIANGCKYRQACSYLLTELYWKAGQFKQAQHMLKPIMLHKPVPWAMVALAKTEMHLNNFDGAITLGKQVVKNRVLAVEGHDILAQCHWKKGDLDEAIKEIKRSISLSPFSLDRQYLGANLARENNDFDFAKQCCKAIFEQTRRSVYRDVKHLCNFVRSILDAAENAAEKGDRNKFQQEALITLQRLRSDDIISRLNEPFDYTAFEEIINARVNFLDGKVSEARKSIATARESLEEQFEDLPISLVPDSLKVYFDLGDYDEAQALSRRLANEDVEIDANLEYLLARTNEGIANKALEFDRLCKEGKTSYNAGKFQAAYEAYSEALKYSPTNADAILNLLQCLLQILERFSKPELKLVVDSKKYLKLVNELKMSPGQTAKYKDIREGFKKHMDLP